MTSSLAATSPARPALRPATHRYVRGLVEDHYDFIWRLLARLKVDEGEVDDAAQQVFMVLMTRAELVIKKGSERSFLFGVALRVAREFRRNALKRTSRAGHDPERVIDHGSDLEATADRSQARRLLDQILDRMPEEQRVAFVLFEIQGETAPAIARLLDIPQGTVASRLRRARRIFQEGVEELRGAPREGRET